MNGNRDGTTNETTPKRPPSKNPTDAEVKPPKTEDDVLGVIEGVEQQLTALRNAHAEHRAAMSELTERRRKLEDLTDELESRESELSAREVELAEMRQEFEQRECDLVQRAQGLEQRESKIASQAESLERREAEIESEQQQVRAKLEEIDGQLVALRNERAELETRELEAMEKLEREEVAAAQLVTVQQELKTAEGKLRGREIELNERSKALEELAEQTGSLDAELSATKQQLAQAISQAQEHLTREQKVSEGLRAQLEQAADQSAESQQLREKYDLLNVQLEEANAELVRVRNESKSALEDEQNKLGDLSEQIAGYTAQIAELTEQLQRSHAETKRLGEELERARAQLEGAPTDQQLEQANATISELRGQIDELGRVADEELTAEREKVARFEKSLAELRTQIDALTQERDTIKQELEKRGEMGSEELAALQTRYKQTAAQLKKVTEQLEQAAARHQKLRLDAAEQAKNYQASTEAVEKLKAQSAALSVRVEELTKELETERSSPKGIDVDAWNATRRKRLASVRSVLRSNSEKIRRATDALRDRYDQCEQVLVKRAELAEAYQAIAEAQQKHARKEVRSGVFLGMTGVGLLVLVLAAISWFAAGRIAPGEYAARVSVVASAGERQLTDQDLSSWGAYMESLTRDPQFIEFAAERMKRRGITALGIPGELSSVMRDSLDVVESAPGTIELEYRGQGAERSQRVLDTFTVALTSAANNARARRPDGATSTMPQVAQAGSEPLDTRRIETAGMVFGGSMLGSLILGGLLWSRLSAAKARFERDSRIEPLLDDSQWTMPGA
ncbi:MAG: hypothetical protein KC996_06435 [Phycisphaerales bacterium]|nr:hypothetical protein [Phycisphaerales bacterium]